MTREKLSALIRQPRTSEAELIPALEEIVARYPYYTNGHILLALQYRQLDHIRFESQLRKTAVHVPDRSVLRKLVLMEAMEDSTLATDAAVAQGTISDSIESTILPITTVAEVTEILPGDAPVTIKLDPREVIEQRLYELKQQEQFVREKLIEQTGLDKPILVPIKKPEEPEPFQVPAELVVASVESYKAEVEAAVVPEQKVQVDQPEPKVPSAVPAHEKIHSRDGKRSFSDWIKQTSSQPDLSSQSIPVEVAAMDYFALAASELLPESKTQSDASKDNLVDKFIREEPRIVPSKSEFYSPGNMARKSAQDHEDLISETLARIYAQQGNITKAIATYERLALKIPQKKSYFASLIEKLKA